MDKFLKKEPLVSIIIPTHNRAKLLIRAIKSVKNQNYSNWELIVIADSCNDKTFEVLKRLKKDSRVTIIESKVNVGGAKARNMGLEKLSGDFVAFLDDDDQWHPNKLKLQVNFLETRDDICIVGSSFRLKSKYGDYKKFNEKEIDLEKLLYTNCLGNFSSCMTKKKYIDNLFIENDLKSCQDWDLWVKVFYKTGLNGYILPDVLVIKDDLHNKPQLTTNYKNANNSYLRFISQTKHLLNPTQEAYRLSNYYSRESRALSDYKLYFKSIYYLVKSIHKISIYKSLAIIYPYWLIDENIKNWFKNLFLIPRKIK